MATDELSTKLQKALAHEVDDYLDTRIKFLRHQVYLYCESINISLLYHATAATYNYLCSRINKRR